MSRGFVLAAALVAALVVSFGPGAHAQGGNGKGSGNARACDDGVDNDGDGYTDHPTDPGCSSKQDNDEYDAPPAAVCSDDIDNDGDGSTDYPADPGCTSPQDTDENDPAEPTDGEQPCLYYDGGPCIPTTGPVLVDGWILIDCTYFPRPVGHVEAWRDDNENGLIDRQNDTLVWVWHNTPICI